MTKTAILNRISDKFSALSYDKIYYYLAIIFAFTLPISRAMVSFFIIVFPIIWVIQGDFKRKWSEIKQSKFLSIFIIFYALVLISLLFSDNKELALNYSRLYLYWLSIFVLATSLKKEWIRNIITAFLFGMLVSEIIAYGVFFGLWEFGSATKANPSPFMMHIDYSIFLSFTSILLFSRILSKNYKLKHKIFMAMFFLSTTGNLFLQTGRTGQVAYIIAIIVMFFLHYGVKFKTIFMALVSLIVIYSLAFNLSENFKNRVEHSIYEVVQISSGNLGTSWGQRVLFWIIAADIFKQKPIFGANLGDYRDLTKKVLENPKYDKVLDYWKEFSHTSHFHNQYLMALVQMGVIGLAFCLAFYFLGFKMAFNTCDKELRDMFMLFMVIYFIGSFTEPLWYKQFTNILWIFIVSLMITNTKFEKMSVNLENK